MAQSTAVIFGTGCKRHGQPGTDADVLRARTLVPSQGQSTGHRVLAGRWIGNVVQKGRGSRPSG